MQPILQIRHLSDADASAYYALRRRSMEGPADPAEPQVLREIEAGSDGIAGLVAGYASEGTRTWGAFVGDSLIAVAALTSQYHTVHGDVGVLWGVFVLPRYRGTPASRLLMASIVEYCGTEGDNRQILTSCSRDNVDGLRFLQRFGFEAMPATDGGGVRDEPMGLFCLQVWCPCREAWSDQREGARRVHRNAKARRSRSGSWRISRTSAERRT